MSNGTALLYNATASNITLVTVQSEPSAADNGAGPAQYRPSPPLGNSLDGGYSFAIPSGAHFTVCVQFDTGETPYVTTQTLSQAAPALHVVAFLNGLVVGTPDGQATTISFTRSVPLQKIDARTLP